MRIHDLCFVLLLLATCGCGALTKPGDVKVPDPVQAVADAEKMMAEKRLDPTRYKGWIYPKNLPPSLQLPGLAYARVFKDHVNLVLARNPDWQIGARIWARDSTRTHQDSKTRYPNIFFFKYSNDLPESPDNIE